MEPGLGGEVQDVPGPIRGQYYTYQPITGQYYYNLLTNVRPVLPGPPVALLQALTGVSPLVGGVWLVHIVLQTLVPRTLLAGRRGEEESKT